MRTKQTIVSPARLAVLGLAALTISFNAYSRKPLASSPATDTLTMSQMVQVLKYPKSEVESNLANLAMFATPAGAKKAPQTDIASSVPEQKAKAREEEVKPEIIVPAPEQAAPGAVPDQSAPKYSPEADNCAKAIIEGSNSQSLLAMGKEELKQKIDDIASIENEVSHNLWRELRIAKGEMEERLAQLEAAEAKPAPAEAKPAPVQPKELPAVQAEAPAQKVEAPAQEIKAPVQETKAQPQEIKPPVETPGNKARALEATIDDMYGRMIASPDSASAAAMGQEIVAFFKANKAALHADQQTWNVFMGKLVNGINAVLGKFKCEEIDARMFIAKE